MPVGSAARDEIPEARYVDKEKSGVATNNESGILCYLPVHTTPIVVG